MKLSVICWIVICITTNIIAATDEDKNMKQNVKQENGKVWIETKGFGPGEYCSSVHGSQARILEAVEESMTYDDLVCYGGFAFRVGIDDRLCPSAGHPCCGYMCVDNSNKAIPWKTKLYKAFPWGPKLEGEELAKFQAEINAAVKESIDRGIPVNYIAEEEGLIIGYADEGKRWWCIHPYHKWGKEAFWYDEADGFAGGKDKMPWGLVVWQEPKDSSELTDEKELTVTALKQAVDMWNHKDKIDEHYLSGDAAYDFWIQYLSDIEDGKIDNPKAGMQGSGWCYDVLAQNRPIASKWLKTKAELFDGETRDNLLVASKEYGEITTILLEDVDCAWSLVPQPNQSDETNSERRNKQIERLKKARIHDKNAIQAISQSLDSMDKKSSKQNTTDNKPTNKSEE